jgi:tetratricopeptide (TPR) repeat protein
MSLTRLGSALALLLAFCCLARSAAPPPALPIDRWIEQLGSEDSDTWRGAVENLWKAGEAAVGALRKADRSTDPDIVLRARLVLARLEWGIRHDTPAAVVAEIENYRDGDKEKKKAAAVKLIRLGRAGTAAMKRLLRRESDTLLRKEILAALKPQVAPAVRERIVAGDLTSADELLEAMAETGELQPMLDLAAFRMQTGTAVASARRLERLASGGDQAAAKRATYLYRAAGDLKSARRVAEKADDTDLLGNILEEMEDYKALAKLSPPELTRNLVAKAVLCWRAGDRDGFESALKRIPEKEYWQRSCALFACDRPREGIEVIRKGGNMFAVCRLLEVQGRRLEALALKPSGAEGENPTWLLLGQAHVTGEMGERDLARRLMKQAQPAVEKHAATSDGLAGALIKAGKRAGLKAEALDAICVALDKGRITYVPHYLLSRLSEKDSDAMGLWWEYLRKKDATAPPSEILRRLDSWFVRREAGKDFDAVLRAAGEFKKELPAGQKERWPAALARACVAVGKSDLAEGILKNFAKAPEASYHVLLGDFYFERRRWADAAAAYAGALKHDPTACLAMYLRGVALVRAGKAKEGRPLIESARLLPLGDEDMRYNLAEDLDKRGLRDEGVDEQFVLFRTAPFHSILIHNVCFDLAAREERKGRHLEAARYFQRAVDSGAFRGGTAYIDDGAFVRVPGWAHQSRANGLIAAGKLDDALKEARFLWEFLPEEGDTAIALIRALDKAARGKDANRVFEEVYGRLRRACIESPRSGGCHNRIGWLSVRCGRRLDEALRHAVAATQATPRAAGVFDTLAEVRFQRGDKEGAVAAMRRAIQLARPGHPYFAEQLRRIEKGDRKADLPPERD